MEAERGLLGRIGCKIVSLREDIDGLHHELAELGQLQDSLSNSRTVRGITVAEHDICRNCLHSHH